MKIHLTDKQQKQILSHGERTYPYEGAGLMLGLEDDDGRHVRHLIFLENAKDQSEQHNRYLITAEDILRAEEEAASRDLSIIGVFHSHPDHPNLPSDFDLEYAIPWYSYLITSIDQGRAGGSRCWRLADDRSRFQEERILIS